MAKICYRRLRRKEKPVFVPLAKKSFEDFKLYGKKWEVRREERQYQTRNIRYGKKVTISCGYGKKRRIRGKIGLVAISQSLRAIFRLIPFREIEPRAKSAEKAIKENLKILGNADWYIAFEIIMDKKASRF